MMTIHTKYPNHIFYKGQKSCDVGVFGKHEGDWERVIVELDESEQNVYRVRFKQHGGHYTRNAANVWFDEDNHVIVHVGKTANGSYYNAGGFNDSARYVGILNVLSYFVEITCSYYADYRNNGDSGKELKTWKEGTLESTEQSHEWFNWKGVWGNDGVSTPNWADNQCTVPYCDDAGCYVGLVKDDSWRAPPWED